MVREHICNVLDMRHHDSMIDGMIVDIGTDFDWSNSIFPEQRNPGVDGSKLEENIQTEGHKAAKDEAISMNNIGIPTQRGKWYDIVQMSDEQQNVVYAGVDTVIKFLNNDAYCKPIHATITGGGGTEKSFIINNIIGMVRLLISRNDTVQVAVPSGTSVFSAQDSMVHNFLSVQLSHPEKSLTKRSKAILLD